MIDKIVYTYWTNGGTNYKLGFLDVENMLFIFRNSINNSKKLVSKVEIYTDQFGYDFLKKEGFENMIIVNYADYKFDSRYWNFPKLITYKLQTEPFLHVDIDASITDFDKSADVVSEAKRGVAYDTSVYPSLEDKSNLLSHFDGWLTCSGILGGNNLSIFQDLFNEVKETVQNKDKYIILDKTRMVIEEIVISCLINKNKIKASYLNKKDYTHYWGIDKQINFVQI